VHGYYFRWCRCWCACGSGGGGRAQRGRLPRPARDCYPATGVSYLLHPHPDRRHPDRGERWALCRGRPARSLSTTPPQPAAAAALGFAALGTSVAVTSATGTPRDTSAAATLVDLAAHLAYGIVTVFTLHRLLDPHTPHAHR